MERWQVSGKFVRNFWTEEKEIGIEKDFITYPQKETKSIQN